MQDVLRFLYIALREYWITWVTGTGLCGFTLWLINFISERVRKKPMTLRTYLAVLFCFFWFLATFSAWHDADKNLAVVTRQRAEDNSKLYQCQSDMRVKSIQADNWQQMSSSFQNAFNAQQTNINSCVVALGKAALPEPEKHTVFGQVLDLHKSLRILQYIITTNRPISPVNLLFQCDGKFSHVDAQLVRANAESELGGPNRKLGSNKQEIHIMSPVWAPMNPLVITVYSDDPKTDNCGISKAE